jgi:hypothetical protein
VNGLTDGKPPTPKVPPPKPPVRDPPEELLFGAIKPEPIAPFPPKLVPVCPSAGALNINMAAEKRKVGVFMLAQYFLNDHANI